MKWPDIPLPCIPEGHFAVDDHGGVGDGTTVNTKAFDAVIDNCHAAGGGTVRIPPGRWLTGPIRLKSRVNLHLEEGAAVAFVTEPAAYLPVVHTRWEGVEIYNYTPLIHARDCEDIAITGKGTLSGNGGAWWHWKKTNGNTGELYNLEAAGIDLSKRVYGVENLLRPSFIQPFNCQRVLIEGITVTDSPMWTLHPVYCRDVTVRGVEVNTLGPNTDGLNPDSCDGVLIEDCVFATGDDCIAINAGMNEDGWRVGKPCRNIFIQRCTGTRGHGGVVIGSAMSGGVENVWARDCSFEGVKMGIRLKAKRGRGGYVRNVLFENFKLKDIREHAVHVNMYYECGPKPPTETPPDFSDITVRNVSGNSLKIAVGLYGLPEHRLRNLRLENIDLRAEKGFEANDVEGLNLHNVSCIAKDESAMVLRRCGNVNMNSVNLPEESP